MDDYLEGIRSAWLGEQFGQRFFLEMALASSDETMSTRWKTLSQLEEVTGNRMAEVLAFWDAAPSGSEFVDISPEIVEQFTGVSHQEAMQKMKTRVEEALLRFDHLLAIAPDQDIAAVQFLVDHEQALLTFVNRELAGDADNSMADVERLLSNQE